MTDNALPYEMKATSNIHFSFSMSLDALCFMDTAYFVKHSGSFVKYMNAYQIEEIKKLSENLSDGFFQDCFNMSEICCIISHLCADNLSDMSLADLIKAFESDDILNHVTRDVAERYSVKLKMLQSIEFEKQYRSRVLPLVKEQIVKNSFDMSQFNTDDLFKRISTLKLSEAIEQADIYMSFFSGPLSFQLSKNCFLSSFNYGHIDFFSHTAHELMHGISDEELAQMYLNYVASNDYLKEMHMRLTEYWNEGNEEEFVLAAEYYLCLLSGQYSREELLVRAKQRYDHCCPVSVMLFDLLSRESEPPLNYKEWLKKQFSCGLLPSEGVIKYLESI